MKLLSEISLKYSGRILCDTWLKHLLSHKFSYSNKGANPKLLEPQLYIKSYFYSFIYLVNVMFFFNENLVSNCGLIL